MCYRPIHGYCQPVRDALAALGAEVSETPITPRRVLAGVQKARETKS